MIQLIAQEKFTSIQQAQAGLTRLLEEAEADLSFYRVLRNNRPLGVLLPNRTWEGLLEDLEALCSANYLKKIEKARGQKKISLRKLKKDLAL